MGALKQSPISRNTRLSDTFLLIFATCGYQDVMVDFIEEGADVYVNHPGLAG